MTTAYVWIVSAYNSYENNDVIAAFAVEQDAIVFSQRCKDHDRKKPSCPELKDPQEWWDMFYRRLANWEKRHPAKRTGTAEDYPVEKIKVRQPVASKNVD